MTWALILIGILILLASPGGRAILALGGLLSAALGVFVVVVGAGYYFLIYAPKEEKREAEEAVIAQWEAAQAAQRAQVEAERQAEIRKVQRLFELASESAIPPEQVEGSDLHLAYREYSFTEAVRFKNSPGEFADRFELRGRIKNKSSRFNLTQCEFLLTLRDCQYSGECEVIGQAQVSLGQVVPSSQARDLFLPFKFGHPVAIRRSASLEVKIVGTEGVISAEAIEADMREEAHGESEEESSVDSIPLPQDSQPLESAPKPRFFETH